MEFNLLLAWPTPAPFKLQATRKRYRPLLRDRNNIYKPEFKYKENEINLNFAAGFKKMIR